MNGTEYEIIFTDKWRNSDIQILKWHRNQSTVQDDGNPLISSTSTPAPQRLGKAALHKPPRPSPRRRHRQAWAGLGQAGAAWLHADRLSGAAVWPCLLPAHRRPLQLSGQKLVLSSSQKFQDSAGNSPGPSLETTWGTLITGVLGSEGTAQERSMDSGLLVLGSRQSTSLFIPLTY